MYKYSFESDDEITSCDDCPFIQYRTPLYSRCYLDQALTGGEEEISNSLRNYKPSFCPISREYEPSDWE